MAIPTEVIMRMATLGLNETQARAVADMLTAVEAATQAGAEVGKEKARERWRNWKERQSTNVSKRLQPLANDSKQLTGGGARVEDKTLTSEIEPQESKKEQKETRERFSDFDVWYRTYPHKVQRGAAEKAWPKARSLASLEMLIAGVERYVASKPVDRPYQNPSTWLNGKGWLDEPAAAPQARASPVRVNPVLVSAQNLMDDLNAVTPSEIEGNHAPPRLVAFSGGR